MRLFKSKIEREDDAFAEALVRKMLQTNTLKALATEAKRQWDFEALQAKTLNYPIIQDLVNTAVAGVTVTVTLTDGTKMVIAPTAGQAERLAAQREAEQRTLF